MPLLEDVGYDQRRHDRMVAAIRSDPALPFAESVAALADGYRDLYGVGPEEINDGLCRDFADDLKALCPRAAVRWLDEIDPALRVAHAVAVLDGRHYDAEAPEGVERPADLPAVRRWAPLSAARNEAP